jgi:hypothetical protein
MLSRFLMLRLHHVIAKDAAHIPENKNFIKTFGWLGNLFKVISLQWI